MKPSSAPVAGGAVIAALSRATAGRFADHPSRLWCSAAQKELIRLKCFLGKEDGEFSDNTRIALETGEKHLRKSEKRPLTPLSDDVVEFLRKFPARLFATAARRAVPTSAGAVRHASRRCRLRKSRPRCAPTRPSKQSRPCASPAAAKATKAATSQAAAKRTFGG